MWAAKHCSILFVTILQQVLFVVLGPLLSKLSIPNPGLAAVSGLDEDNLTKGQLELSGLSITLLLQDPPSQTDSQSESNSSQDHVLCKIADRFFDRMSATAFGRKDLEMIQEKFNDACVQSHLRYTRFVIFGNTYMCEAQTF